jgi:hypothetical protein
MAGCDPNHSAPVQLANVLVRIDVPHAATMTRRGTTFKASMGLGERPTQRRVIVPTVNPWTRIENTTTT